VTWVRRMRHTWFFIVMACGCLNGCSQMVGTTPVSPLSIDTESGIATSSEVLQATNPSRNQRIDLTAEQLVNGVEFSTPLKESTFASPAWAGSPQHVFEGSLNLLGDGSSNHVQLIGSQQGFEENLALLPDVKFELFQVDNHLIPVQRGVLVTSHPSWNILFEPGMVWYEPGDGNFTRASLPFTLVPKGGNSSFNGTMTFLFNEQMTSDIWYQVTQETSSSLRMDLWGWLQASYRPHLVTDSAKLRLDYQNELRIRLPSKPIEELTIDYPDVDLSRLLDPRIVNNLTWYGMLVDGVNYLGGCNTRYGRYTYCEAMRAASFSTAKSLFPSLALMRLAEQYGSQVADQLISKYVPEASASPGDWEQVTFNNALDMATGNFRSTRYMSDEDGAQMSAYHATQPFAARIAAAFDWPNAADAGGQWVYRTSDTFIVTLAMQNFLSSQTGEEADIFDYVVEEVYQPVGLTPGAMSSMRTADGNWHGQAEGGYGLWWVPEDIARLVTFLGGGSIDGVQILNPAFLAAALQQDVQDRGMLISPDRRYNNAFWANSYGLNQQFDCQFWVINMLGVSGNVVAIFPNGITFYYFSDSQIFDWQGALQEADKIHPLCGY